MITPPLSDKELGRSIEVIVKVFVESEILTVLLITGLIIPAGARPGYYRILFTALASISVIFVL